MTQWWDSYQGGTNLDRLLFGAQISLASHREDSETTVAFIAGVHGVDVGIDATGIFAHVRVYTSELKNLSLSTSGLVHDENNVVVGWHDLKQSTVPAELRASA